MPRRVLRIGLRMCPSNEGTDTPLRLEVGNSFPKWNNRLLVLSSYQANAKDMDLGLADFVFD